MTHDRRAGWPWRGPGDGRAATDADYARWREEREAGAPFEEPQTFFGRS